MNLLTRTIVIGIVATGVMDVWGIVRRPLFGFPRADYRLVGRWFAYMPRGRFHHASIAASPPLPGEHAIGLTAHYLIGITFAALLVRIGGPEWIAHPTLAPALLVGLATVVAPLLIMQPGMGAGIAASRTPDPTAARLQSVLTHLVYGVGLYAAASLTQEHLMHIPARFAPILFSALLSAIMVAIVSAFVLVTDQGWHDGLPAAWLRSCMTTWPVAFPTVALVAPVVRSVVGRITA